MRMLLPPCRALPWVALGFVTTTLCVAAEVAAVLPETASPAMVEACERSARQAVPGSGRQPVEVSFTAAPTVQPGPTIDGQIVLRGAGRFRAPTGMRSFTYTCNVDVKSSEAVAVMLRDTTPQATAKGPPPKPPAEPDLSELSPAACESSAVQALKRRWPQVAQIRFDSATRSFQQKTPSRAELHGHGRALPVPEAQSTHFGFECEIDTRDGRIVGMRISG